MPLQRFRRFLIFIQWPFAWKTQALVRTPDCAVAALERNHISGRERVSFTRALHASLRLSDTALSFNANVTDGEWARLIDYCSGLETVLPRGVGIDAHSGRLFLWQGDARFSLDKVDLLLVDHALFPGRKQS